MRLGIDIGSTTIKAVVLDDEGGVLFSSYERHFSKVADRLEATCCRLERKLGEQAVEFCLSGSAGMGFAQRAGLPFVQEVAATRAAVGLCYPQADCVIELGGEDAKILFLTGLPDARMNGSCAGGTGAFIDQMATLLKITPEELGEAALAAERCYPIASRCGVFAKSDIQPLLNQGASREDVCRSILAAVATQAISGLAQGRKISGNVLYLGGPLTFLPALREAFDEQLGTRGILAENSLYFVAIGAALEGGASASLSEIAQRAASAAESGYASLPPLFSSEEEYYRFLEAHSKAKLPSADPSAYTGRAYLGIDAGSTTVKTALIDESGNLLHASYAPNTGSPITILQKALLEMYEAAPYANIIASAATGYGEKLAKEAFCADYGIVETIAHYKAARFFAPDVDFIIDIGGQDMKCFRIEDGLISDIFLNEACSSGCGSFLQAFAEALGIDIGDFASLALYAPAPAELGSRCTVFMNSAVKQAQKDGASLENISAGLAYSVVQNALYKVIRVSSPAELGKKVVVQGGMFYNDAVLRAFEAEMGVEAIRPNIAGLMGAFGAALYAKEMGGGQALSRLLRPSGVSALTHTVKTVRCGLCNNRCVLTVNRFPENRQFISGNRCERPVLTSAHTPEIDLVEFKQKLLASYAPQPGPRGAIGLPMALGNYEMLSFWHAFFTELGFSVVTSPPSTRDTFVLGQSQIPSDTVCYPAKLSHGHIASLIDSGVKTIFFPCMSRNFDEGLAEARFNCPIVAYYPKVNEAGAEASKGVAFIDCYIDPAAKRGFPKKMQAALSAYFPQIPLKEVKSAARKAYAAYDEYRAKIRAEGLRAIEEAKAHGMPIVILAGRPYHVDGEVNHAINKLITQQGAAVLTEDSVPYAIERTPVDILNQWSYHARLYAAAAYAAANEGFSMLQLASFGCGLDAITADEARSILRQAGKMYALIKIDEISNTGAASIRVRSLIAALNERAAKDNEKKDAQSIPTL